MSIFCLDSPGTKGPAASVVSLLLWGSLTGRRRAAERARTLWGPFAEHPAVDSSCPSPHQVAPNHQVFSRSELWLKMIDFLIPSTTQRECFSNISAPQWITLCQFCLFLSGLCRLPSLRLPPQDLSRRAGDTRTPCPLSPMSWGKPTGRAPGQVSIGNTLCIPANISETFDFRIRSHKKITFLCSYYHNLEPLYLTLDVFPHFLVSLLCFPQHLLITSKGSNVFVELKDVHYTTCLLKKLVFMLIYCQVFSWLTYAA